MIFCFPELLNSSILPFMTTIVIANQKGGSGKCTSTVHLAVAAEQAGDGPVVISDTVEPYTHRSTGIGHGPARY
jgi:Mrp family chromosome partitioning ATPase